MRSAASREAEALEQLGAALAQAAAAQAVDPSGELEVLAPGRLGIDGDPLADRADHAPYPLWLGEDVEPGDRGAAGVGSREGGEDLDRRRLAGAVRPEQAEDRARPRPRSSARRAR